jgi:hypothetical protein
MGGPLQVQEIQEIFHRLHLRQKEFSTLIETGTWRGETIRNVVHLFEEIHSVEINHDLYAKLQEKGFPTSVKLHLGDSSLLLSEIIPLVDSAAVFFLDAHWCCLNTGRGTKDVPLIDELACIVDFQMKPAVIIIDDVRLFGLGKNSTPPYPVEWGEISVTVIIQHVTHRLRNWFQLADRLVLEIEPKLKSNLS